MKVRAKYAAVFSAGMLCLLLSASHVHAYCAPTGSGGWVNMHPQPKPPPPPTPPTSVGTPVGTVLGTPAGQTAAGNAGSVGWSYSYEEAEKSARSLQQPFLIFFCSAAAAKVAGEGTQALEQYKKANSGVTPRPTLFDNANAVAWLRGSGIGILLKVTVNEENAALVRKFEAAVDNVMICAPDGEKLVVLGANDCTEAR